MGDPVLDAASNLVASTQSAYIKLVAKATIMDPDAVLRLFGKTSLLGVVTSWFDSKSSQEAARDKAIADLGGYIKSWAGTKRTWAINGKRDDGTPYTWVQWLDFGVNDLGSAIKQFDSSIWNDSTTVAFVLALKETGEDIGKKAADIVDKGLGFFAWLEKNSWVYPVTVVGVGLVYFGPALGVLAKRRASR